MKYLLILAMLAGCHDERANTAICICRDMAGVKPTSFYELVFRPFDRKVFHNCIDTFLPLPKDVKP